MFPRYIAYITIEATTPLKVGSGNHDFFQGSPIQRDWNELPMIPGTSIAGVLRKDFSGNDDIFGYQRGEDGEGSKIIISNALLVTNKQGEVCEGLLLEKTPFLERFDNLPIREHTAITDKGVAKEHGKYDEEVVFKGARFKFAIEVMEDKEVFDRLIGLLQSPTFRLGGGSTKGFGELKIYKIETKTIATPQELASHDSSLNASDMQSLSLRQSANETHIHYRLEIAPEDFFMFGSGFGDEDADHTPVKERMVDYDKEDLSDAYILMPASSIKGAIAHRTAYHYNKAAKIFADKIENMEDAVGANNHAVKAIFGEAKNSKKKIKGSKGKLLISDLYQQDKGKTKVFDHVAIDRFTGSGIDGALFNEKTIAQKDMWGLDIYLEKDIDKDSVKAFEAALKDICTGMLPLGGAVTKGHGVFTGKLFRDGEEL